ncbi:MAG: MBL fold metallo-hydrolase [Dehalococcoidia bacterium]|jgi:ribonuclease Z|nr:MBL fold metallo-hydrolase [Dehalococcoidia bacterium]
MGSDVLEVTLLGTGSPIFVPGRFSTSTLIRAGDEYLLVDCGRGAGIRLHETGLHPGRINKLFLTHLHSDHVVGIPDFYISGWFTTFGRREGPLRVWGPEGTTAMMSNMDRTFEFDERVRASEMQIHHNANESHDIEPGVVFDEAGVRVTAFYVDHRPIHPALGFKVEYAGRSMILSGDTRPTDSIVEHGTGADLMIHEVICGNRENSPDPDQFERIIAHHTTPQQAGTIFNKARPRLAVYSHVILVAGVTVATLEAQTRETYDGPLLIGEDLTRITVGDEITVEHLR